MNLRIAAQNKFEGCERPELVVYCEVMGIEVKDGHNVPFLRKKLLAALGEYTEVNIAGDDSQVSAKALRDMNLADLNLSSAGRWQGKRRVVTLHRAAAYSSDYPLFLAWENLHVYMPYGSTAALPWPIWKILESTSDAKKLVRRRITDPEGRVMYREDWVPDQPFMYTDEGDDPDTKDLPGSMVEAVRMMYYASDGFKTHDERQLREICRRLRVGTNRDWTRDQLVVAVQTAISIPISMTDGMVPVTATEVANSAQE